MPASLVTRINLDYIYPPFLGRCLDLIAKLQVSGIDYYAVSGYRSVDEQNKKYAIGRSLPGKRITNAVGGRSMHNFGLAVDVAMDKDMSAPGLQPDWTNSKGQYAPLQEACGEFGLQVGVPSIQGGDPGHIQVPVVRCLKMQEPTLLMALRGVYLKRGNLKDCWAWLDERIDWDAL